VQSIKPDRRHIRSLPDLKTSDFRIEPQRFCTINSRHPKSASCRQHFRSMQSLLKEGCGAHLCEHVETVVTCRAIRSEGNGNSLLQQLHDRRDSGTEF
jgi:hypothetical protein